MKRASSLSFEEIIVSPSSIYTFLILMVFNSKKLENASTRFFSFMVMIIFFEDLLFFNGFNIPSVAPFILLAPDFESIIPGESISSIRFLRFRSSICSLILSSICFIISDETGAIIRDDSPNT